MNGYVNKQNCRIRDDTNPHEIHQHQMHPKKATVLCGFWSDGIIGPYFFQNNTGIAITVNGECYRSMISNLLWPKLDDMDVDDMWFQHRTALRATMDILRERFEIERPYWNIHYIVKNLPNNLFFFYRKHSIRYILLTKMLGNTLS